MALHGHHTGGGTADDRSVGVGLTTPSILKSRLALTSLLAAFCTSGRPCIKPVTRCAAVHSFLALTPADNDGRPFAVSVIIVDAVGSERSIGPGPHSPLADVHVSTNSYGVTV